MASNEVQETRTRVSPPKILATNVQFGTQNFRPSQKYMNQHKAATRDDDGRLVLRTSSQVPFLVRDELCHVFGLSREDVHVFTRRIGGGFGGKQEMLTEDIVALAVLRLGRPVRYEFSRSDEFTMAPCRHPFRIDVTAAAGGGSGRRGVAA